MQYAQTGDTWSDWLADNSDNTDDVKLTALREFIVQAARRWVDDCTYDAAWANKKLAKLGITERISVDNAYDLRILVTAVMELRVYGQNRDEALSKAADRIDSLRGTGGTVPVMNVTANGAPEFIGGPEDAVPSVADDAPQTVSNTLAKLREIVLLGHIAGPRICETEANRFLAQFGLDPIPPRQIFKVSRPVTAVATTHVQAYDEASAERVARWRWENGQTGYTVDGLASDDEPSVAVA